MPADEFELIDRFFKDLTPAGAGVTCGIGDDAAVVRIPDGHELVVSTDTLVSGVHFPPATDPADIGFKSLAVNLSDMAAMGAEPRWATLALTMPSGDSAWLSGFSRGFAELAKRCNVSLIGGDMSRGPLTVTVQILGTVAAGTALRRCAARAGEDIYVTGLLGDAAYALSVWETGVREFEMLPAACRQHLLRPLPRIDVGLAIRPLAAAAIDISDGLAADLQHILDASRAGAEVELAALPLSDTLKSLERGQALELALTRGDDYELCFTAPERYRAEIEGIASRSACGITRIGRIVAGGKIRWISEDGSDYQPPETGYRHFK